MSVPNQMGYQAYNRNKFETASPHKLILMLYDGVLRYGAQAEKALDNQEVSVANQALKKMQDILYELIACLDMKQGGDVARNLQNIYSYSIDLLIQANIQKDKSKVVEAVHLIKEIRSAWEQIGKEVSIGKV